jgi:alpha-mannosidase
MKNKSKMAKLRVKQHFFKLLIVIFLVSDYLTAQTPDFSKQKTLNMVSSAHFDTQWKWTVQTSINNYLLNTLHDNFALLDKYPDYLFNFEGAIKYMWTKEYYPYEYGRLKEFIAKNRWHISGSSIDAGDVNIPSPESVIRNILLGQDYFKKEFGKTSTDIFLPDCFGFPYSLPSIMGHCGLNGFSTLKLSGNSANGMPFDIGVWEGVDGSKVLAEINPGAIVTRITGDLTNDSGQLRTINKLGDKTGVYVSYKYYGTGDRGGSPTEGSVEWLEKSLKGTGPVKVVAAPSDLLANQMTPGLMSKLEKFRGELILSTHGTGCYTSQAYMKLINRRNELLADATERASVGADWLGSIKYSKEKIREAWIRFLWHQFHDDLTGTSIPEAYSFSWNDELVSQNQFSAVLNSAVGGIARALDTQVKGRPLVIYNPAGASRNDVVEASLKLSDNTRAVHIFDTQGKEVPSQIVTNNGNEVKILFVASLPPVGFAVFDLVESIQSPVQKSKLVITKQSLENQLYKVKIDNNGDISGIYDKKNKKELLSAPMRLELLNDTSVNWPQWEIMYKAVKAAPRKFVTGVKSITIEESGPVRITLKVVRETDGSTFTQFISLADGVAGSRVDIKNIVDWKSKNSLLKASFPLSVSNPNATYDLGMGTIERGTNKEKMYEVPAQQWADLSASNGSYGVTIMNDCKYGWDKPSDNTLRLTLLHTPTPAARYPISAFQDFGTHQFTYSVSAHSGSWKNETTLWQPVFLNQPLIPYLTDKHPGQLGKSFSFGSLNTPNVAIKAMKKAENSDEIVIRLQELTGSISSDVVLTMPGKVLTAREINGAEEPIGPASIKYGKLVVALNPFQPKAFAITISAPGTAMPPVNSVPVPLRHNLMATSTDVDRSSADFDGKGHSIPAELFPGVLNSEGVIFQLGTAGGRGNNATISKGNIINLPSGEFNRIYILATATEETQGTFKVDEKSYRIGIQGYSGLIGQSSSLIFDDKNKPAEVKIVPGWLKSDNIAWVGTHRHDFSGINEAYVYCYLYKYAIDVPAGAKTLSLPDNDKIRIMAVTMSGDQNCVTYPVSGYGQGLNGQ